ncbi:MAG: EpsG family protein [Fibromonadales bacterium]|nr:EpsG family protein [Fibromonadales bacterium]
MIYYLVCFSLSLFLLWFGQKIRHGQCEPFRWFVYGIALLIPAVLAGARDLSIGTDVLSYAYPVFEEARVIPYIEGFSTIYEGWIGTGYLWLNYALSQVTSNFNIILFFIIFIEIIFVFFTIYQWRDKFPIWLGMLVFYAFFFNLSFNAIRQCLALSIAFFGIKYIFERKFLLFAFWVLLGYLFHKSAILVLAYYPLFWYANKYTSKKSILLLSVIFLSLIIFSNQIFIPILSSLSGVVPRVDAIAYYLAYIEKDSSGYKNFIYFALLVLLFLYKRKIILNNFQDIGHFLEVVVIITAISQLTTFVAGEYANRFIIVPDWMLCFSIPIVFYSYIKTFPRTVINIAIIFYCFFYWFYIFIYLGFNETRDYSSSILSSIF